MYTILYKPLKKFPKFPLIEGLFGQL
jgi:hypothetical protein